MSRVGQDYLIAAAERNDLEIVNLLLNYGADPAQKIVGGVVEPVEAEYIQKIPDGQTALYVAAKSGNLELVELLLRKGADPNAQIADTDYGPSIEKYIGETVFESAVSSGSTAVVKCLITAGANLKIQPYGGQRLIEKALEASNLTVSITNRKTMLRFLLSIGVRPRNFFYSGRLYNFDPEIAQLLLDHSADSVQKPNGTSIFAQQFDRYQGGFVSLVSHKDPFLNWAMTAAIARNLHQTGSLSFRTDMLQTAAQQGNASWIQQLIHAGIPVDTTNGKGQTALHIAAQSDDTLPAIDALLLAGAQINARDMEGQTPLQIAAEKGRLNVIERLIGHGAQVELADHTGQTAIHRAALTGQGTVVRRLLVQNPKLINLQDKEGYTPAHLAVYAAPNLSALKVLIDAGANLNLRDRDKRTVLERWLSAAGCQEQVFCAPIQDKVPVEWMITHGAHINDPSMPDFNPLSIALSQRSRDKNYLSVIKTLLSHGANIQAVSYGWSYLFPEPTTIPLIDLLLSYGADANTKNDQGQTLLHSATRFYSVTQYLISHGADVTIKDKEGNTPLHNAVSNSKWSNFQNNQDVVKLLLAQGARADAKNNEGKTPLSLALEDQKYVISSYLQHGISKQK